MDFAAQLAKLERQAANAAKKNSNSNSTNTSHPNGVDHQLNHSSTTGNPNRNTSTTSGGSGSIDHNVAQYQRRHPRDRSPPYHRNNGDTLAVDHTDDRSTPQQRRRYNENYQYYTNDRGRSSNNSSDRNQQHHHSYSRRLSPQQQSSHNSNKNPFYELQQCGFRIRPSLPWVPKSDRTKPHICLLAIIIDDLPYEHIWKAWANHSSSSSNACSVSLVCHAKYPKRVTSPWVRQRLLVQPPQLGRGGSVFADPMYHTHVPEWGSIHIARAMIDCLKEGVLIGTKKASDMKDERYTPNRYVISQHDSNNDDPNRDIPTVDKFIFISESCLPVMALDEYVQILFPPLETTNDIAPAVQEPESNTNSKISNGNISTHDVPIHQRNEDTDVHDLSVNKDVEPNTTHEMESKVSIEIGADATTDMLPSKTEKEKEVILIANSIDPWEISWVNGRSRKTTGTPRNMYENNQFQFIDYRIPDDCRFKADQWILLSRRHAIHILHIDEHISHPQYQFWTLFQKISASDEMFFPTALGILGLLKDDEKDQNISITDVTASASNRIAQEQHSGPVLKRSVTYTDWSQGMRNPTSFTTGIRDFATVARLAREQQCLLARKFVVIPPMTQSTVRIEETTTGELHCAGQITVDEWMDVIQTLSGKK